MAGRAAGIRRSAAGPRDLADKLRLLKDEWDSVHGDLLASCIRDAERFAGKGV